MSTKQQLQTSHQILLQAGEPHSLIRVQNLQAVVTVGTDAWGRSQKAQPALISAEVSLRERFETAAGKDVVDGSTIHYGILSKGILSAIDQFQGGTLVELSRHVEAFLVKDGGVVDRRKVRAFSLDVLLSKGSLLGSGVQLSGTTVFGAAGQVEGQSRGLKILGLRIPTLVGVNSNERLAKQVVIASVEIDRWADLKDRYAPLEELVVKTIEESSFETLEAMAMHVGSRIISYFLAPSRKDSSRTTGDDSYERIKIRLEKPTAVMFADAPAIEVLLDSHPSSGDDVRKLWEGVDIAKAPPFPLQGRLDEWIKQVETS